jgi:CheY-like chemotaxis protein
MTAKLIKVLLVEDDPGDAFWIKELLEAAGRSLYRFELQHFSRLSEALEYLAVETPDAVLLDLELPESQGMQTLRSIIDVAPHVPVVVLTGFADVEFGVAALPGSMHKTWFHQWLHLSCPLQNHRHGLVIIPLHLEIGHPAVPLRGFDPGMPQEILDGHRAASALRSWVAMVCRSWWHDTLSLAWRA